MGWDLIEKKFICAILIILNIIFIIGAIIIKHKYYGNVYRIDFIFALSVFSLITSYLYLANAKPRFFKEFFQKYFNKSILIALSGTFTVTIYILFYVFLPKYTVQDAYTIVTSDTRFISGNITNITPYKPKKMDKHGNPFAGYAYRFLWEHNEITEWIYFDPMNGAIYSNLTKTNNNFVGEWNKTNTTIGTAAVITIKNETLKSFDFSFIGVFGGNGGSIDGTATILDENKAVFEYKSETDIEGTLKVQFLLDNDSLKVGIVEGFNYSLGFGNHVVIDGEYTKSNPVYTNVNIINEILPTNEIKDKLKNLLGEDNYKQVLDVIQDGIRYEDNTLNYSGFLDGCGQGVDLLIKDNKLYCLTYFIGAEGYTLYTNDKNYKKTLPSFFHIDRQDYKLGFVYKP